MTGRAVALAAAALVLALPAAPAAAQAADPVFAPADAQELVDLLARATAAQGVCYGWDVEVVDQGGSESGRSAGSGAGPGQPAGGPGCDGAVTFRATITYTSEASESDDSAAVSVDSDLPGAPTSADLGALGLAREGDLVGDEVDDAVFEAVVALPGLVAEAGLAPPVVASPAASAPADVGELADDPGSDFLRTAGWTLATGVALLLAGLLFAGYAVVTRRPRAAPGWDRSLPTSRPPTPPTGVAPPWPGPPRR